MVHPRRVSIRTYIIVSIYVMAVLECAVAAVRINTRLFQQRYKQSMEDIAEEFPSFYGDERPHGALHKKEMTSDPRSSHNRQGPCHIPKRMDRALMDILYFHFF